MSDKIDAFHWHELLHTAHIMCCMWQDHIQSHPATINNDEIKAHAEDILTELGKFYQTVGKLTPDE